VLHLTADSHHSRRSVPSAPPARCVRVCSRVVALLGTGAMLASCREGVLDPHGPVGEAERVILYDATAIMLVVVVPVIILTLAWAWWFRAGNRRATYRPEWEYSGTIELIVWAIPALVILFLGGIAWIGSHELDPPTPLASTSAPLEVEVVSLDWQWLFIYPGERIATVNHLVVPAGVPVHFRLTSTSVMNSFFIPQLGSQIYTMTGMTTQLNLQADRAGAYDGLSAQFSGPGFSDMRFTLVADSEENFASWVAEVRSHGGVLDGSTFAQLARPTRGGDDRSYGSVVEDPFDRVAHGQMATVWSLEEAH
jgi:cytochrome o ubiquinol oxidase subunit II